MPGVGPPDPRLVAPGGSHAARRDHELLRLGFLREREHPDFDLDLEGWEAAEQPGVDMFDRDALFDLMEGR